MKHWHMLHHGRISKTLCYGKEVRHKKPHDYTIPFIWNIQNWQIHKNRKQISSFQGIKKGGNGEWLLNGYGISLWDDGNVLELERDDNYTL